MKSPSDLRLIDVHHHIVLPEYQDALERSGAADPSRPLRKNPDAPTVLRSMAEFGIDAAVLNPLSVAGVHHGNDANARYLTEETNEALAKFVSHAPERLGFFATLPLPDVDGALRQLEFALDSLKADGVILLSNQNGSYVGDPAFMPLYEELHRRSVVVFIHPARPDYVSTLRLKMWAAFVEYTFETTRVAANLIYNGVVAHYPGIKWILAHAGGALPFLSVRMKLMENSDRETPRFIERVPQGVEPCIRSLYFDVAMAGGAAPMAALAEAADPSRILFGSDWPYLEREFVADQISSLTALPRYEGERLEPLEWRNAARLFDRFAARRK